MANEFELDSVDFITIDTIGPPGERIFHLQAGRQEVLVTLIIEKEQAAALAASIVTMLEDIEKKLNVSTQEIGLAHIDMDLREPILPMFRVGQIGLGYNSEQDRIVLLLNELQAEDAVSEPRTAHLTTTREQIKALAERTQEVVAGGRPICGNCGWPIDPDGHFCPKSNGHKREIAPET